MDAMVSARVPIEIKQRGDKRLKEIGSTATELVNAAYHYVIEHGELPAAHPDVRVHRGEHDQPQVKTLAGDAAQAFTAQWQMRSVLEVRGYDGTNFKQLLDEAKDDYFARFA